MKPFFIILLSLAASLGLAPHFARAAPATTSQPTYIWHGPRCMGDWDVCSIDPPDPHQNFGAPCYFSRHPDYEPNIIEQDSIDLCQAARNALVVPPSDRVSAINLVIAWALKFVAAVNADPSVGAVNGPYVAHDLINLKYDLGIYNAAPSATTWQFVANDFKALGVSAEVSG